MDSLVLVSPGVDLFDPKIEPGWVDQIFEAISKTKDLNFLVETSHPEKFEGRVIPENCWIGVNLTTSEETATAERILAQLQANVKVAICAPTQEIKFAKPGVFNWMVIRRGTDGAGEPPFHPEWAWIESLLLQARELKIPVFFSKTLTVMPTEYPLL